MTPERILAATRLHRATITGPRAEDPHRLLVCKELFCQLGLEKNQGVIR